MRIDAPPRLLGVLLSVVLLLKVHELLKYALVRSFDPFEPIKTT